MLSNSKNYLSKQSETHKIAIHTLLSTLELRIGDTREQVP